MNENDVRRVLSEKKEGFNVEAGGILHDVKYDDEEYDNAKTVVFSEPPVDILYDETVDLSDAAYVLIIESLPGQYDQRADSAAQCIQFMTAKERPIVKCARIIAFYGTVSDEEKDKIKGYLINPVEAREASAEKPATLVDKYDIPTTVPNVDGFLDMSDEDLEALRKSMGLAMSFADIKFVQDFFKEQGRVPTVTEIRVLDTYWSDHCRRSVFLIHTGLTTAVTQHSLQTLQILSLKAMTSLQQRSGKLIRITSQQEKMFTAREFQKSLSASWTSARSQARSSRKMASSLIWMNLKRSTHAPSRLELK